MFNRKNSEVKRVPMMPVRDMVIFPQMMTPVHRGPRSLRARARRSAGRRQEDFPGHAARRLGRRSQARRNLPGRHARQHRAEREAARRQHQSAGRRRRARQDRSRSPATKASSAPPFACSCPASRAFPAGRAGRPAGHRPLRAVREALAEPELRHHDRRRARGRSRASFPTPSPPTCRFPSKKSRNCSKLFDPLERLNRIADILEVEIEKLNVDRTINTRVKRQMERAQKEYYLNEKLKAIQKELGRGEKNEIERAEEENRNRRHAQGSPGKGHAGAEAAGNDAADVGGIHRQPQLSRLAAGRALEEALQGNSRHQARRKNSRTKITTASKRSKNASSNIWPFASW